MIKKCGEYVQGGKGEKVAQIFGAKLSLGP
jgi:hypothetical protein